MTTDGQKRRKRKEAEEATPLLLPPGVMPERPDLVAMVRKGEHKFTGERVTRDMELCRNIVQDMLLGLSGRAVARKWRVSRGSLCQIERILRERGELQQIKDHLIAELDDIASIGLERWKEALINGEIHPGQIPIPVLAALDKRAQLAVGAVVGTGRTERELSAEDDLADAWRRLKSAHAQGPVIDVASGPADAQSIGSAQIPQQSSAIPLVDAGLAASGLRPEPAAAPLPIERQPLPAPAAPAAQATAPAAPGDQASAGPAASAREGGGGGARRARGGAED